MAFKKTTHAHAHVIKWLLTSSDVFFEVIAVSKTVPLFLISAKEFTHLLIPKILHTELVQRRVQIPYNSKLKRVSVFFFFFVLELRIVLSRPLDGQKVRDQL